MGRQVDWMEIERTRFKEYGIGYNYISENPDKKVLFMGLGQGILFYLTYF